MVNTGEPCSPGGMKQDIGPINPWAASSHPFKMHFSTHSFPVMGPLCACVCVCCHVRLPAWVPRELRKNTDLLNAEYNQRLEEEPQTFRFHQRESAAKPLHSSFFLFNPPPPRHWFSSSLAVSTLLMCDCVWVLLLLLLVSGLRLLMTFRLSHWPFIFFSAVCVCKRGCCLQESINKVNKRQDWLINGGKNTF